MMYRTDGAAIKAISFDSLLGAGFEDGLLAASSSPAAYYAIVPYVRRAVELRMAALASVPLTLERRGVDVTGKAEWKGLMGTMRTLLMQTEFAVCLAPTGATWRKTTNRVGANPTPVWLVPSAVYPVIDAALGLTSVRYTHPFGVAQAGQVEYLALDEVVRFWLPNLERANWPGPPPGLTALAAAGVLANKDAFLSQYFQRGAIKSVLLQVPPESKPSDRDRLNSWWRAMTNGIGNAWRSIVVSTAVTPLVLGDGLTDMNNADLTQEYRQEVATAFGIPQTMLLQQAANFATAQVDRISFFEETVFPELHFLIDAINTQWLSDAYDARLIAHEEQTETRQAMQLEQAGTLTALVGQPVMTVNEGRAWLGLEPFPDENTLGDDDDEDGDEALKRWHQNERATLRRQYTAQRQAERSPWTRVQVVQAQRAALDSLRTKQTAIEASPAVKRPGAADALTPKERRLARLLTPILERYGEQAVTAVLQGQAADLAGMSTDLRTALLSDLADVALASMTGMAKELRYGIDPARVTTAASEWAKQYTYQLVNGLTQTSQAALQQVVSDMLSTVGMTREQVAQALAPVFGPARAEMIAVTEITRAASAGVELTRKEIAKAGIEMGRVWQTNNDELTCPVCGGLNGKPEAEWNRQYPDGPPAHPNCRCAVTLEVLNGNR
jgi:hypothetical protein